MFSVGCWLPQFILEAAERSGMSVDHELRNQALLFAHIGVVFKTYQAIDEDVRENLLRSLREQVRQDETSFFRELWPEVSSGPKARPISRASIPASDYRAFKRAVRKEVLRLLDDLATPHRFDPPATS